MNTLMANRVQSNVAWKQKMLRDVKLLYDVMADTIGYTCIQGGYPPWINTSKDHPPRPRGSQLGREKGHDENF